MDLDIRTIIVMFAILSLMFAGLLELAGLQAGNIRGIRLWAIANSCFGLGLGLAYFYTVPTPDANWALVTGSTLVAIGVALQYSGIHAFKEQRSDWRLPLLLVIAVCAMNTLFVFIHPDVSARAIANALLLAVGYAACARALLIKIEPPLRTAYWFTGLSFAVLALVLLARATAIWLAPSGMYSGLYTQISPNPLSFFVGGIVQLFVTFGFVLMLDYRLVTEMRRLASRDALTGAYNRRRLEEEAVLQWAQHLRTGEILTVMLIDIDHFKAINDLYGHQTGDEVLRRLVAIAQASIRANDYFARYGGEEFCILLPATTEQAALVLAERLRGAYEDAVMTFGGKTLKSTISIGVADSTGVGPEFSALIAAADRALYRAKQTGRNRVALHSGSQ
ncbi:MAG: GGDEF domain-containing protein [Sulfuriferula sp.]|nr:GGDEF domain-containing protein [Sulfuriferula sp.]